MIDPYHMSDLATVLMSPEAQVIAGIILACFCLGKFISSVSKNVPIQDTEQIDAYKDD